MMLNHFKAYRDLMTKIRNKNMELIKLKDDWYSLTGIKYDDVKIQGGKPLDIADQLHNIVEKEKTLTGLINYKNELRRIHEKEINKLDDSNKRTILQLFYLDFCSIKEIAYCLKRSESRTKALKRKAIEEFIDKVIL